MGGTWPIMGIATAGRGEAPEHQGPFAADHDEADAGGDRHRERRQDKRRRALQRVLQREAGSKAASPDIGDEVDRRLADRQQKDCEQRRRDQQAQAAGLTTYSELARSFQMPKSELAFRDPAPIRSREAPVATGASDMRLSVSAGDL